MTWQELIAARMGAPASSTKDDDMRACTDDSGGVYVFGPGIWQHVTGPEWGAWERFTGPAERVNDAQRDMLRATCLASGDATWSALVRSGIDGQKYAAGDVLSSTERNAHEAATR